MKRQNTVLVIRCDFSSLLGSTGVGADTSTGTSAGTGTGTGTSAGTGAGTGTGTGTGVVYRARFQLFTQQVPVFVDRLQKLPLTSL